MSADFAPPGPRNTLSTPGHTNRSLSWLRDRRAYCIRTLADPTTAEHRKSRIIHALDHLDACLRDRCQHCGRPLSLPESVARSAGAVCAGTHGAA